MFDKKWKYCIILCFFPVFLMGKETDPSKIIQNVERKLTSAKSVKVIFQQTYIWQLTGEEQSLKGELLLQGENRFHITTEDQVIVSDGQTLWTYSKPSHRVLIDRLSDSDNTLLPQQILFQYTKSYFSKTIGEESMSGKNCAVVMFTTETGDVFFPEVRVWIEQDTWIPRKVEQIDINDNRTIYELNSVQFDLPVDLTVFNFIVPEGAEVIDMR